MTKTIVFIIAALLTIAIIAFNGNDGSRETEYRDDSAPITSEPVPFYPNNSGKE